MDMDAEVHLPRSLETLCAEDMPGYTYSSRNRSRDFSRRTSGASRSCLLKLAVFLVVILVLIPSTVYAYRRFCGSESCLPSWFRDEKRIGGAEEMGAGDFSGDDPIKARVSSSQDINGVPLQKPTPIPDSQEYEDLDQLYGTAKPLVVDHKLEEAKQILYELKCKGYCLKGTCQVHVDEQSYELKHLSCSCPPDYHGSRCEKLFIRSLYAPAKSGFQVENSAVVIYAFLSIFVAILIVLLVVCWKTLQNEPEKELTELETARMSINGAHSVRMPRTPRRRGYASTRDISTLLAPGRINLPNTAIQSPDGLPPLKSPFFDQFCRPISREARQKELQAEPLLLSPRSDVRSPDTVSTRITPDRPEWDSGPEDVVTHV